MAEISKEAHIVEIPVDAEHRQKLLSAMSNIAEAIEDHPLTEISESPGHLLLLKLWQRQEQLFGRRVSLKESRMDSIKQEIFKLCCFFFIFHGLFLTLLFTSSTNSDSFCKKWWIPSVISLCTSIVFVFMVQIKIHRYWKVWKQLEKDRNENRGISRSIQELRMKGASFDLSKDPCNHQTQRMKSSSVEIKWKPLTWCYHNLLTICLVCFTGLAFPASKLILCVF